jgi:mannose-6-phosphate isomerase-like protein (cupin superfamily)
VSDQVTTDTHYKPSPRPTFDRPTLIRYADITRHVWGDDGSGEVMDWIYVSSAKIHQLLFGLAPGKSFRHSDQFRTVFAADEVLYVLSGVLIIANAATGEVHPVEAGEAVFFRRDTWHHAFSYGPDELRVLELFAPPPAAGTSGAYARTRENLVDVSYADDAALQRWPMDSTAIKGAQTMRVVRRQDCLWRLEGQDEPALVGILASTEHLTVATMDLRPGQRTSIQCHAGDKCGYVLDGTIGIRIGADAGREWLEAGPGDGFYLPEGVPHRFYNPTSASARMIFGVAPRYTADGS